LDLFPVQNHLQKQQNTNERDWVQYKQTYISASPPALSHANARYKYKHI
jgi:hypothetical protein